jgi:hypothetical protein
MKHAVLNLSIGGTAESGAGTGIQTDSTSAFNLFEGLDTESLGKYDYNISGTQNTIRDAVAAGTTNVSGSAFFTQIEGGMLATVTDAGYGTRLNAFRYTTLTRNGSHTDQVLTQTTGNAQDPWRLSTPLSAAGTLTAAGLRPVVINGGISQAVTKQGDAGVWSFDYGALGYAGTDLGGFGISGSGDALSQYWIGTYESQLMTLKGPGNVTIKSLPAYPDNAAAVAAGLAVGRLYRLGDGVGVVH